jgi:hypothetical protein
MIKGKVGSLQKFGIFYTETVNSSFHLYGCGYHHNRIDPIPLAVGTLY